MRVHLSTLVVVVGMLLCATEAAAHVQGGAESSLGKGLLHPVSGIDHLLAMVAVGLWAGNAGGRAVWAWPVAFLGFMAVGGGLGLWQVPLPVVEVGIAVSVVVLGGAIALRIRMPIAVGSALCAAFAVFHGHAHGAEMSAGAGVLDYAVGFLLATALLHAAGIGLAFGLAQTVPPVVTRLAGAGVALTGLALFLR